MSDSKIDATGLDRKYQTPSLKKLIAISVGMIICFMKSVQKV